MQPVDLDEARVLIHSARERLYDIDHPTETVIVCTIQRKDKDRRIAALQKAAAMTDLTLRFRYRTDAQPLTDVTYAALSTHEDPTDEEVDAAIKVYHESLP